MALRVCKRDCYETILPECSEQGKPKRHQPPSRVRIRWLIELALV